MREILQGFVFAACFASFCAPAVWASPLSGERAGVGVNESTLQKVDYDSYCSRLRYRCDHKDELGQEGEGNCRRYHNECGEWGRRSSCRTLRYRCEHKEDLGQEGEGNCRRYYSECGGRSYN